MPGELSKYLNISRVEEEFNQLAAFTDPKRPYTRRAFTPLYDRSRKWLAAQMEKSGLTARFDSAGNLIGTLPGSTDKAPAIMVGSHIDTVYEGGRFDGIIGVLAALEASRIIQSSNKKLSRPLEIVDFTSEEPSDFGISTIGSRAMAGILTEKELNYTNEAGKTLKEALHEVGGNPNEIEKSKRNVGALHAYLELHIEQGRVLEANKTSIAIVESIVGIHRYKVTVQGRPDHAGTTPMEMRSDALVSASIIVEAVETISRELSSNDYYFVGTVGLMHVRPNSSNVIPGEAEMVFEFRSDNYNLLRQATEMIDEKIKKLETMRNITISKDTISETKPLKTNQKIKELQKEACQKLNHDFLTLPSGAGHDSVLIGKIAPIGMFFVPSKDGRSHCPEEWTDFYHITKGIEVLTQTILELDNTELLPYD